MGVERQHGAENEAKTSTPTVDASLSVREMKAYLASRGVSGREIKDCVDKADLIKRVKKEQEQEITKSVEAAVCSGSRVTIHGLTSEAGSKLNDQNATLVSQAANGRWVLRLDGAAENKSLASKNLRLMDTTGVEPESALCTGSRVTVHGLTSEAGSKLNGKKGALVAFSANGRWVVGLDGVPDNKSLSVANLRSMDTDTKKSVDESKTPAPEAKNKEELKADQAAAKEQARAAAVELEKVLKNTEVGTAPTTVRKARVDDFFSQEAVRTDGFDKSVENSKVLGYRKQGEFGAKKFIKP